MRMIRGRVGSPDGSIGPEIGGQLSPSWVNNELLSWRLGGDQ